MPKRSSGSTYMKEKQIKKQRVAIAVLILSLVAVGVTLGIGWRIGWFAPFGTTPTTEAEGESTFTLISYVDGEDVSDFVEISIWTPEDDAEFDDMDDVCSLISNFDEDVSSTDAEDASLDVSDILWFWVEIDPDGETVFSNQYLLYSGGTNYDYTIYVHDLTTDVNFNMLTSTMDEVTVADYQTDGSFKFVLDCPRATTTAAQLHVGTNWDIEQTEYDEMTASELAVVHDEGNWADQMYFYDPTADTIDHGSTTSTSVWDYITSAFALKMTFNDSVSTVDGATTQVNMTLDSDVPAEVIVSGSNIYVVWYGVILFNDGVVSAGFDLEFGTHITLSDIDSGRVTLPARTPSAFTKYSDIGA